MNCPRQYVSNILLEGSREIAPEAMKKLNQRGNDSQLWICPVVKAKSNAVNTNIAYKPGMLGP